MQGAGTVDGNALLVDPSLMAADGSVVISRWQQQMIADHALSELPPTPTRFRLPPGQLYARSCRTTHPRGRCHRS